MSAEAHSVVEPESTASANADDYIVGADGDESPVLSVIMPTLNEEQGVKECLPKIKAAVAELEVPTEIIISDSSTDRTPEIGREHGAIVIEPDQKGYGYAYRYAFNRARGQYIAIGDADTTYDFEELPKLYELVAEGEADLALGSRLEGTIRPGAMPPLHRYIGNPVLTAFLNIFYDAGVSDAHSGFRVISAEALDVMDLQTNGMEFASEMIMEASAQGLTIEEEPITYHDREGEETLDSFRDGWRHVRFMLLNAPGYLFSVPGVAVFLFGVLLMGLSFFNIELAGLPSAIGRNGVVGFGLRSMIAGSLLTMVGYQVASQGVFATIASSPIRQPSDPITTWITDHMRLEWGATAGAVVFLVGVGYAGYLIMQWLTAGYDALPVLTHDIVAFTAIVLGVQTIFNSFFLSAIGGRKDP